MLTLAQITRSALIRIICPISRTANYCAIANEKLYTAISDAENLIGYSAKELFTELMSSKETAAIREYVKNEIDSRHPLVNVIKNVLSDNSLRLGLVVMLLSKSLGTKTQENTEEVFKKQRSVADIAEMIRLSHVIHKSLVNADHSEKNSPDINFGNKIAMLGGDFMLGKSYEKIANLRNQNVNQLLSSALRDLVESQFYGPRNVQNEPIPVQPKLKDNEAKNLEIPFLLEIELPNGNQFLGHAKAEWTMRNILNGASLLGKACQSSLYLAKQSNAVQKMGNLFGKHVALSWQAYLDREALQESERNRNFSLVSAPVLFHLEQDPDMYEEVLKCVNDANGKLYEGLRNRISTGTAFRRTELLKEEHKYEAFGILDQFPINDEHVALKNIMSAL